MSRVSALLRRAFCTRERGRQQVPTARLTRFTTAHICRRSYLFCALRASPLRKRLHSSKTLRRRRCAAPAHGLRTLFGCCCGYPLPLCDAFAQHLLFCFRSAPSAAADISKQAGHGVAWRKEAGGISVATRQPSMLAYLSYRDIVGWARRARRWRRSFLNAGRITRGSAASK